MKCVRVRISGDVRHGVVDGDVVRLLEGGFHPLSSFTGEKVPLAAVTLEVPVEPSKLICVGRNYMDHIREMGYERPSVPSLFMKPPTTMVAPGGVVVLPPKHISDEVEHEAELAVVIGREGRTIPSGQALDHVFGYTCANDVSARDLQRRDSDVVRAKGFDTFCPIGPWVETELSLNGSMRVRSRVNGEIRQDGAISDLIFDVPFLISYLSSFTTLLPGDVILTGSPGGSGPMRPGDSVEIEVSGIGVLTHEVR